MIEDDDLFKQNETLTPEKEEKSSHVMLILLIAWLVWTLLLSIYFVPKVISAVKDSGVLELIIENKKNKAESNNLRTVTASFITLEGEKSYTYKTNKRGGSKYHDIVESLISGAPEEALKEGAVSLVNPKTKLIGLSYGDGICYVNLSPAFLSSSKLGGISAETQVRNSLLQDDIEKVVFLIDGVSQNL